MLTRFLLLLLILNLGSALAEDGESPFSDLLNMKKNVKKMYGKSIDVIEAIDNEGKAPEVVVDEKKEKEMIAKEKERRAKEQEIDRDSDDFLLRDPNLNYKYQKGPYLVYDCQDHHWVCTGRLEYMRCEDQREHTKRQNGDFYTCQTIKKFESLDSCLSRQRRMTDYNPTDRFCYSKDYQQLTLKY